MPSRKAWLAVLAIVAFGTPCLRAQGLNIPGIPSTGGVPGAGAGLMPGAATNAGSLGTAVPQSSGCLNTLMAIGQRCKAKLCASQFGQMSNSLITGPMGAVTGGFIPSICPPPGAAQAAALAASQPGSAAAAAAAIQASEADAKARVAAIEYLGTVDCTRWPEAQKALINGLRQDPNECVRFAAARALNSGCCCNKKVIDAMRLCISGETTDGAPAETSVRVKGAAFSALQNCLMRVPEELPPEPQLPAPEGDRPRLTPVPPAPESGSQRSAANPHIATAYKPPQRGPITYDEHLSRQSFSQTVEEARRALVQVSKNTRPPTVMPARQRSVFGALVKARTDLAVTNQSRIREQKRPMSRTDQPREPVLAGPAPSPTGAGLESSAVTPASGAGPGLAPLALPEAFPGVSGTENAIKPAPKGVTEGSGPMSSAKPTAAPTSSAHRGLIGMLFSSHGD